MLEGARAAYGLVQLVAPGALAHGLVRQTTSDRTRVVIRVLGARHLAQAALTAAAGSSRAHAAGGTVDALHAVSMLALALLDEEVRVLALASAADATTGAVVETVLSRALAAEPG